MTGQEIIKMHGSMNDYVIGNWMNLWQECADWCWPTNDAINNVRIAGQEKPPQRLIDTCIEANHNFAAGFFSNTFPPNTIWAKFRHPIPEVMGLSGVAEYFERVSRVIHQILVNSNFSQEEFQSLISMGCFGTTILSVEEDDKDKVRFRNFIVKNVRIQENSRGKVDVVSREYELTPRQAVQEFGLEKLAEVGLGHIEQDLANPGDKKYTFIHYVAPREDFDRSKKDSTNKPIASIHASKDSGEIVKESGFDYMPYKVSRFAQGNDEVYGRSPMSMVLGTTRRTNVIYRSANVAAEQHSNPQWLVPDDDSVSGLSSRAGAVIKWRMTSGQFGKPERLAPNGDPGTAIEMYKLHDDQIRRAFFNHLFRPLEEYRNMSATEVMERSTADMMLIAPFVSRYLEEHVSPVMEAVYYICAKKGLLPAPPPELSEYPEFEIDYVGRLNLATKSNETMGAINTARVMGEFAALNPEAAAALDYVDFDKVLKEMWYSQSASMTSLREDKVVDQKRQIRQQQMEQQRKIDNLPAVADATQKLGKAAEPNSPITQLEG